MLPQITACCVLLLLLNSAVHAQDTFSSGSALAELQSRSTAQVFKKRHLTANQQAPSSERACSLCPGLLGIGLGLGLHEAGHLVANVAFQSAPYLKGVRGAGLPFFAVAHRRQLSARQESIVSSAGLWAQFMIAETLLTRAPHLQSSQAPYRKGILAFHVGTSFLYGVTGLTGMGPPERDTRTIGNGSRSHEVAVGSIILAVGLLDSYRYYRDSPRWATWVSRSVKLAMLVPVFLSR